MDLDSLTRVEVAIVSDTHGHLDERVAELVAACDVAVHAGDIMGRHVLDMLRPRSGHVVAVRGNNDIPDKWSRAEHDVLRELPLEANLVLPGGRLAIVHGHQHWSPAVRHARLRGSFPTARAIVYGHSHYLVCDQDHEPWVLNPGASGRVRTHGGPSCLVLSARAHHWHVQTHRFAPQPAARRHAGAG